jgi:hypothetical protein
VVHEEKRNVGVDGCTMELVTGLWAIALVHNHNNDVGKIIVIVSFVGINAQNF